MVSDENNLPEVREVLVGGLGAGLKELHTRTTKKVVTNMAKGQDALGNSWQPLKPETIRQSTKSVPLVDSGDMRRDILASSEVDVNRLIGMIGTSKEYGVYHELGAPEAGIPRRPFLAPTARYAEKHAEKVIGGEIDTRLGGAML